MNDMSGTIVAKSDQINAADLIGGPITVIIREVHIKAGGDADQPVSIYFDDEKKAFRPCLGVRRLLVHAWGLDANNYIGRRLTLFRDPKVIWAGKEEGGIRVSHMTDIPGEFIFPMRISRTATKQYKIEPLLLNARPVADPAQKWADAYLAKVAAAETLDELSAFANEKAKRLSELQAKRPDLHRACVEALDARRGALAPDAPQDAGFEDWGGED